MEECTEKKNPNSANRPAPHTSREAPPVDAACNQAICRRNGTASTDSNFKVTTTCEPTIPSSSVVTRQALPPCSTAVEKAAYAGAQEINCVHTTPQSLPIRTDVTIPAGSLPVVGAPCTLKTPTHGHHEQDRTIHQPDPRLNVQIQHCVPPNYPHQVPTCSSLQCSHLSQVQGQVPTAQVSRHHYVNASQQCTPPILTTTHRFQQPVDIKVSSAAAVAPSVADNTVCTPMQTSANPPIPPHQPTDDHRSHTLTDSRARLQQQRKYLNNVRDPAFKHIIPHLRTAVDVLSEAQDICGDNIRLHLFAEHQTDIRRQQDIDPAQHRALISFYTFFSKTFFADTEYKRSLVRDLTDVFAKFNVMHNPLYTVPGHLHTHVQHVDQQRYPAPTGAQPPSNVPRTAQNPIPTSTTNGVAPTISVQPHDRTCKKHHPVPSPPAEIQPQEQPVVAHYTADLSNMPNPSNTTHTPSIPSAKVSAARSAAAEINGFQPSEQVKHGPSKVPYTDQLDSSGTKYIPSNDASPLPPVTTNEQPPKKDKSTSQQSILPSSPQATDIVPSIPSTEQPTDNSHQLPTSQIPQNITSTSTIRPEQLLPPSVQMIIPPWFPYIKRTHSQNQGVSDIQPGPNNNPDNSKHSPVAAVENCQVKNTSTDPSPSEFHAKDNDVLDPDISAYIHKKLPLLTVDTSEFTTLSLQHVKFIYRVLFKAAFHRYYLQKDPSQPLSSPFTYTFFTPPWLPDTIHCRKTDAYYDFTSNILPHLQALRNGSSASSIYLILAAFKLKEPNFASQAIDFLVSNYDSFPPTCALFKPPKRLRSVKRPLPALSESTTPSSNLSHRRKRHRSVSTSKEPCFSPPNTVSNSSARHQATASQKLRFVPIGGVPIDKLLPQLPSPNSNDDK